MKTAFVSNLSRYQLIRPSDTGVTLFRLLPSYLIMNIYQENNDLATQKTRDTHFDLGLNDSKETFRSQRLSGFSKFTTIAKHQTDAVCEEVNEKDVMHTAAACPTRKKSFNTFSESWIHPLVPLCRASTPFQASQQSTAPTTARRDQFHAPGVNQTSSTGENGDDQAGHDADPIKGCPAGEVFTNAARQVKAKRGYPTGLTTTLASTMQEACGALVQSCRLSKLTSRPKRIRASKSTTCHGLTRSQPATAMERLILYACIPKSKRD